MDISYNKGIWGYAPLIISLANTREPLYLVNRPGKCQRAYPVVALRKNLTVARGETALFDEIRYFFYITTLRDCPAREIVRQANQRCDQENLIGQMKSGLGALRMPVGDLVANWAYMVMAALAWSMKAWFALLIQEPAESRTVLRMEFKRFVNELILLPCQVLRKGGQLLCRVLAYGTRLPTFFKTLDVINRLSTS